MSKPTGWTVAVLAGIAALGSGAVRAQTAPVNTALDGFLIPTHFEDVKVSPDGRYFAASTMSATDTGTLVVLEIATHKNTGLFNLRRGQVIHDFEWVTDRRLIMTIARVDGSLSPPQPTGELQAADADGARQELLIGSRDTGERAFLIDALADDDKAVLIGVYGANGGGTTVERMNVRGGKRSVVTRAPLAEAAFLVDPQHRPRFAWGLGNDGQQKVYYRDGDGDWELVHDERSAGARLTPLAFGGGDHTVYVRLEEPQGPDGVYAWDTVARTRVLVARDDTVDPAGLVQGPEGTPPWGVLFLDGKPRIEPLLRDTPDEMLRRTLAASFPNTTITVNNYSRDGNRLVFRVWSDRNPGDFYLFDRREKRALYLLSRRQWIDPDEMLPMQPIRFTAADGTSLHGFLTLPKGGGKRLPLVVNPHPGPIGRFNVWGFDAETQLLASRGFAVLHVNYRGSGNYGRAFRRAGLAEWGARMADDVGEAVRWAVATGVADGTRVCLYGHGYGAYVAAQALRRAPELFKCGVGYAGVYDLLAAQAAGTWSDGGSAAHAPAPAAGVDLAELSPARHAAGIAAPMLLIVGNNDTRIRPEQSRAMRDALQRAGQKVEWLERDEEGHGFLRLENNRDLYARILAFFDRYLGRGAVAASPAKPSP